MYGFKTWSVAVREKHRLRVFENRMLRKILNLRGNTKHYIKSSFTTCTPLASGALGSAVG
jgi:hypothetical protein